MNTVERGGQEVERHPGCLVIPSGVLAQPQLAPMSPKPPPHGPLLTLELLNECPCHPRATGIEHHVALREENVSREAKRTKARVKENIKDSLNP